MNLQELIKEYKEQAVICATTDYSNKDSVKSHNKAVNRMYQIVDTVYSQFGLEGLDGFSRLLDLVENGTNVWAAVHIVEKMNPDPKIKEKALSIIKKVASENNAQGLGFRHWLKHHEE